MNDDKLRKAIDEAFKPLLDLKRKKMSKELTYEREYGPEDFLFVFVYEIEPYNAGGKDEPPSGGYALVTEIRDKDGEVLPQVFWKACGLDITRIEEDIYEYHGEMERGRREDAEESAAESRRESRYEDYDQRTP